MPDVQYYWTAFELLQKGEATKCEVQNWIAAVDTRREDIWRRLRHLIRNGLNARGLAPVKVFLAEGTTSLRNLLLESLEDGKCPSVDESLFTLRNKGPQASPWNEFLEHIDETSKSSNLDSLNHLIHIYNTVNPALSRLGTGTTHTNHSTTDQPLLLVVIDDIAECEIFDGAKSYLQRCHNKLRRDLGVQILGLFPIQKIFVEDDERSSLWARCPGTHLRIDDVEGLQTPGVVVEKVYEFPQRWQSDEA